MPWFRRSSDRPRPMRRQLLLAQWHRKMLLARALRKGTRMAPKDGVQKFLDRLPAHLTLDQKMNRLRQAEARSRLLRDVEAVQAISQWRLEQQLKPDHQT